MAVTVDYMVKLMEEQAPLEYALDSDGSGLLLGDPAAEVTRTLIAVDLTDSVLEEAIESGANMLIVHHPPLFRPIQQFRYDRLPGKLLLKAVGAGLVLYAAHTNLDVAPGGVNDVLAMLMGLDEVAVLAETGRERLYKIVVFVPEGHDDPVRDAMAAAGAGHIGNYSHCTFQIEGVGTFKPLAGADPFIGDVGHLERVREVRLETIVAASARERVIAEMCEAHPYEEVAYDVYPLANPGLPRGLARAGDLKTPLSLEKFIDTVRTATGAPQLRVVGDGDQTIARVVVCAGRLAPVLIEEALSCKADCLVAGEIRYHEFLQAMQSGIAAVEIGHFRSERPIVQQLVTRLQTRLQQAGKQVVVVASRRDNDPVKYY